jgi:D-alanyl-lipoteichoic acid acyltransferase DltB (MBOAT superfamily)
MLLLAASYYFYMCWRAEYLILIIISTLIDYVSALQMGKHPLKSWARKKYLILSLVANLGLLFMFKYFDFFSSSMRAVFDSLNMFYNIPAFDVLLPVGISFYTFQTLSYSIDVYRGKKDPESHLGIFALYVSFFPQLVAGPIERSTRLLPQFFEKHDFDYERVTNGLKLMVWGFFKKVVIADRLAVVVNQVYNNPTDYTGVPLILATYAFAFQIYCDFSGYSDIAIGGAQVLGYDLMKNFKRPYFAKSIAEFWKRWHISLSSWFQDYLYISLGGNRVVKWRWYSNLIIVFLVSGLWHGANWTFVVWGALHGSYLVISILTKRIRERIASVIRIDRVGWLQRIVKILITSHLAIFAWIFFRANSLSDAWYIATHLFTDFQIRSNYNLGLENMEDVFLVGVLGILLIVQMMQEKMPLRPWLQLRPMWLRWSLYFGVVSMIMMFRAYTSTLEFIYFQF